MQPKQELLSRNDKLFDKTKRNAEYKILSDNSRMLTVLGLCAILVKHHKYEVIFERNRKKSKKTMKYFPISKMKGPNKELIMDRNTMAINKHGQLRTRAIFRLELEKLIKELVKYGYNFDVMRVKGKETSRIIQYQLPCSTKEWLPKEQLNEKGVKVHNILTNYFENAKSKLFIYTVSEEKK
ncbi:hypothetical protein QTN25_008424 [Entamoeba marina]